MAKIIEVFELLDMLRDHMGDEDDSTKRFELAISDFETAMTEAAEMLAEKLGVDVNGPAIWDPDGAMIGFSHDNPTEEMLSVFEQYDTGGGLND